MCQFADGQSRERTLLLKTTFSFKRQNGHRTALSTPMPSQHMREILSGPLTAADLERKAAEGWKPAAVIWSREAPADKPALADITQPVPYGLKIAEDCVQLEQDMHEREALLVMLELIILDKSLSAIAEELNQRGFRTRLKTAWTPGSVFDLLPRLIEVGPRVFSTQEWAMRRGKLMQAVS
jgi:hypothetical protein